MVGVAFAGNGCSRCPAALPQWITLVMNWLRYNVYSGDQYAETFRQAFIDGKEHAIDTLLGDWDRTALHLVSSGGVEAPGIATLLLEKGANINAKNNHGNTPLHLAAIHGMTEVIRVLLNHGAKLHATNDDGKTALRYASSNAYPTRTGKYYRADVVKMLQNAAYDPTRIAAEQARTAADQALAAAEQARAQEKYNLRMAEATGTLDCVICFGECTVENLLLCSGCGHTENGVYHKHCIQKWFKDKKKKEKKCPVCSKLDTFTLE